MLKPILLKLAEDTHERWSQRARAAGMNLSQWIRAQCDGELEDAGEGHPPISSQVPAEPSPVARPQHHIRCPCEDCQRKR